MLSHLSGLAGGCASAASGQSYNVQRDPGTAAFGLLKCDGTSFMIHEDSTLRSLITALIGGSRPHFDGAPASTSTVTTAGIVFGTWAGTLNASIDLGIAQY